jgi:ketose-bisphosphate aldolase
MALEKVCDILKQADKDGYAVMAFDAFNLESISWIIETAEEENTPVILMIYPTMKEIMPLSTFAAVTRDLASKVKVPVGLILDHGPSFEVAMEAIKGGFSSIMVDYSSLSFEENVSKTREMVRIAHPLGIDVESELGHVGMAFNESDYADSARYADPKKVIEFIEKTDTDVLAVAIGSAHGNYVSEPKLDLNRLDEINRVTDIPLVLHGGTGIPKDQLQDSFRRGINKLNLGTGYNQIMYATLEKIVADKSCKPRLSDLILAMKGEVKEYIREMIRLGRLK